MTTIYFKNKAGDVVAEWQGEPGLSLMEVAQEAGLDIEGTCEGNMACATCHLIIEEQFFSQLSPPSEEEEDMLDFVQYLSSRSRLSCQIKITEDKDGLVAILPG